MHKPHTGTLESNSKWWKRYRTTRA